MTGLGIADTKVPAMEPLSRPRKRNTVIIVGSLLGIVVVAGVVLAAFYVGAKIGGREQPHKAVVVYHTNEDGKAVDISETIVIKEKEVDVKGPDFTMINDYEKFLSVMRVEDEEGPRCLVANLNTSVFGTRDQVKERYNAPNSEVMISNNTPEVTFAESDVTLNANMLGDNARQLCAGIPIVQMAPENELLQNTDSTNVGRNKRGSCRPRRRRVIIIIIIIVRRRRC